MNPNNDPKSASKMNWPGRQTALRRLLLIALVLFPCTWIITAMLVGSWNLLGNRDAESIRHLTEAAVVFVSTTGVVFLLSLLPLFQNLVGWLFSWRLIRRVLIVSAWLITLIALFYGEENWRGRHAWNKYSGALTARGEKLDFKAFIPKPISDADNFAATPEIQSWFIRYTNGPVVTMSNFMSDDIFERANAMMGSSASDVPRHTADLVGWQMAFDAVRTGNTNPAQPFKSDKFDQKSRAEAAAAILVELKPLEGPVAELRAASSRPHSHYPVVYDLNNPWGILLPHLADVKGVCLRLDLRACAELAAGQTDRAFDDVKFTLRMSDSLDEEPFLISYLVRLSTFHLATHSIWEGLADHRWSDAQLKELQTQIERYDFIADMSPPLHGERAAGILTADLLASGKYSLNDVFGDQSSFAAKAFGKIMPRGWYELEKLNYCRLDNLQLEGGFDPGSKRVFPDKIAAASKALDQALGRHGLLSSIFIHHQMLSRIMLPALGKIPLRGALGQVTADEALLACALERYRIAHEQFPKDLDALTPDFISKPPHDVITSEPYKYRRTADSFVLYSVGWNQIDDGGQVAMKGNSAISTNGDWVWQYPAK